MSIQHNRCNVLFVGGGRRVTLAKYFQERGRVFSYETDQCPIAQQCQVIPGKLWTDLSIYQHLKDTIDSYNIHLTIPLHDEAVRVLAELNRSEVSPVTTASVCFDKYYFQEWMLAYFPTWYPKHDNTSPVICKPRFGYGSRNIHIEQSVSTKAAQQYKQDGYIIQKYVSGGQEYTVDAYFNKHGKMVGAFPRTRLRVAGGEVINSCTVQDTELITITKRVGETLKLRGPICMQYIKSQSCPHPMLIEINARFGGGSTLTLHAGFDMIDLLIKEYVQHVDITDIGQEYCKFYKWQTLMLRYLSDTFTYIK